MGPVGRPVVAAELVTVAALTWVAEPSVEETKVSKQRLHDVRGAGIPVRTPGTRDAPATRSVTPRAVRGAPLSGQSLDTLGPQLEQSFLVARRAACKYHPFGRWCSQQIHTPSRFTLRPIPRRKSEEALQLGGRQCLVLPGAPRQQFNCRFVHDHDFQLNRNAR